MFVAYSASELATPLAHKPRTSVAIGIFDGVHLGHQALLRRAKQTAQAEGGVALACTFHPHPAKVLRPEHAPLLLEPLAARLAHFAAAGIDGVLVHPFDAEVAQQTAEAFVEQLLLQRCGAKHVVVGENFVFGHRRGGNQQLLQQLGQKHGFSVHALPPVHIAGTMASSSQVRAYVLAGELPQAAALLGRPFALHGPVVHGLARGRTLGYPTANLAPQGEVLPPNGIYAGRAEGPFGRYNAAISIGVHPTFEEAPQRKVEAYLLDYPGDAIYGQPMQLSLCQRLRDEMRFADTAALLQQMRLDVLQTRALLTNPVDAHHVSDL